MDVKSKLNSLQDRFDCLLEASETLESSLQYEETLKNVARLAVPRLGDYCIIDLLKTNGTVFKLMTSHRDPLKNGLLEKLKQYPPNAHGSHPLEKVLKEKCPLIIPKVTNSILTRMANCPEHLELLKSLNPISYMFIPMVHGDKVLGAMVFVRTTESGLRYNPCDLPIAEDLARRCAQAISNAELYESARKQAKIREETIAIVSHDLKNPINAIQLSASLSKTVLSHLALEGEEYNRLFRMLNYIEVSAARSLCLIQDLLDLARVQNNGFVLIKEDNEIDGVIDDVLQVFKPLADEKNIALEKHCLDSQHSLCCDKERLNQVLSNLLGNAVKFTPENGKISVGTQEIEGGTLFWVQDTGPGIPSKLYEHLFEPYYQAEENRGQGLGLGLSIAKGIVEAHGGHIWAESEPGNGSTFFFVIPRKAAASKVA